ncbi:hypothetical protein EV424DRAFT_396561 [Suillus variegatus]|nr:hypothetical protein EV424DRAFT_396561 [Suillus variegatus]
MLSALFAITVSFIGFWFATSDATTSTISGTVGCSWNMRIIYFSMPFLPSFVFALGLFFLALIRAIQSWRTARGHLGAILVKHNMFYYACSLCESGFGYVSVLIDDCCSESSLSHERPHASAVFLCFRKLPRTVCTSNFR